MYQILIVEDDRGLNQGIALALRQEGVSFLQAYNAAEGRDFWEKGHVDMALLDVNLPDGNGYELLEKIRKTSQIPGPPVFPEAISRAAQRRPPGPL